MSHLEHRRDSSDPDDGLDAVAGLDALASWGGDEDWDDTLARRGAADVLTWGRGGMDAVGVDVDRSGVRAQGAEDGQTAARDVAPTPRVRRAPAGRAGRRPRSRRP